MTSIAVALKHEITRLARKETREEIDRLRKAAISYRRDITDLRKQIDGLRKQIALIQRDLGEMQPKSEITEKTNTDCATTKLRFSAAGLKKLRGKLGLSASDLARLLGVSPQTIYNWESDQNVSRPKGDQLMKIAYLRKAGKKKVAEIAASISA